MLKLVLILFASDIIFIAKGNVISRGQGVTERLNNEGISSTVYKTQQLNADENAYRSRVPLFDEEAQRKNENAHFRLYYNSNSPGRSVKHELEHRYFKHPNSMPNYYQEAPNPQYNLNTFESNTPSYLNSFQNSNMGIFIFLLILIILILKFLNIKKIFKNSKKCNN